MAVAMFGAGEAAVNMEMFLGVALCSMLGLVPFRLTAFLKVRK